MIYSKGLWSCGKFNFHLLLGHELARSLIHLRIVNADAAKYGEGLEKADFGLVEFLTVLLK